MTNAQELELTESLEDYLEAIFRVIMKNQVARPKDILKQMNVAGGSLTGALRILAKRKLINYVPYELITLTSQGAVIAERVFRRHEQLRNFLCGVLQVEYSAADAAACKMEHVIPTDIIDKLVRFAAFIEKCPRGGNLWISGFEHQCDMDSSCSQCDQCVKMIVEKIETQKKINAQKQTVHKPLNQLFPGEKGRIVELKKSTGVYRRLIELGATPGTVVEVELTDSREAPIKILLRGYALSLSEKEAEGIVVNVVS